MSHNQLGKSSKSTDCISFLDNYYLPYRKKCIEINDKLQVIKKYLQLKDEIDIKRKEIEKKNKEISQSIDAIQENSEQTIKIIPKLDSNPINQQKISSYDYSSNTSDSDDYSSSEEITVEDSNMDICDIIRSTKTGR